MARDYICLYHSYLDAIQALGDAERGRLLTAMLEYSITGAAPQLGGNERYIFPLIKAQIDRDRDRYNSKCAQNAESARKRTQANASERYQTQANGSEGSQDKGKGKGKGKGEGKDEGKDKDDSPDGENAPELENCGFSPALRAAVEDWLAYKRERREAYKPTGLKALLTQISSAASAHGDAAVIGVIRQSMSSGYKGITFDRLRKKGEPSPCIPATPDPDALKQVRRLYERVAKNGA